MILTFILEQFASAANNSQNRVFCAGSTMDVNDVVKAKMWLFFPILDTKKKRRKKQSAEKNTHKHKNLSKPPTSNMVTTKTGQYFFLFLQYFVRSNKLENCRVWMTFCLDSHNNVIHRNQKRLGW